MRNFISKKYQNIQDNSFSGADDIYYKDLIDFSLGDPDIHTDELIIQKTFEDTKKGYTHYTNSTGLIELRQEICKYQKEEYNLDINTNCVMVTTSACHAMFLSLNAILDEEDEVIIQTPHFTVYDFEILNQNAKTVYLETFEKDNFQIDINRLKKLITPKTKAIIINTPNNPTGACLDRKNLEQISNIAIKYDLLVIADDIYTLFSYQYPFVPISTLEGMKERTITIRSFSKDFLMTGWRIGYLIAQPNLIRILKAINDNIVYSPPSISQRAAIHALRNRSRIQPKIKKEFEDRLNLAYQRIQKIQKLKVLPIRGTFYLFVNIQATNMSSIEFCEKILKICHIRVMPGTAFGKSGEGYIRLSMTLNKFKINEAFDRIEKWLL